jgi:hypothetical protein
MRPSRPRRHSAAIITAAAAMAATREPQKSSRTITAGSLVAVRRMARVQEAVAVWKGAQRPAAKAATMAAAVVTAAGKVCENECRRFASPPLPPMLIMFNIQLACLLTTSGGVFQLLSANKISLSFCLYQMAHLCKYVGTRYLTLSPRMRNIRAFPDIRGLHSSYTVYD